MKDWKSEDTTPFFLLSALGSGQYEAKTGKKLKKSEEKFEERKMLDSGHLNAIMPLFRLQTYIFLLILSMSFCVICNGIILTL